MEKSRPKLLLPILNSLGFLGTAVVNALANILPLNNKTTGQLSDQYPNLFVPAALTFSIWGAIYFLLAIFITYQFIAAVRNGTTASPFTEKIGVLFFVACLANMGWIFAWHYEHISLSVIIMLLLLGCLLAIYLRLGIGKSAAGWSEKYLVHLPFSVYLGWITIATIANATAWLVNINWNTFGLGEQFWAVAVIIIGIGIALTMLITRKDIFYCLVVDWALLGILLKRLVLETAPDQAVVAASITGLALITVGIIVQIVRKKAY